MMYFVGGGNLISEVSDTYKRIAIDNNIYVIEALKLIRDNPTILPQDNSELTEEVYKFIRNHKNLVHLGYVGYIGYSCSFGGKWFGGYRRDKNNKDYTISSYKNALKQSKKLNNVEFICKSYDLINYKKNSIIYCDPPYCNKTTYSKEVFDYKSFWGWCRSMSKNGYNVFISELNAPDDFKVVWNKEIKYTVKKDGTYNKEKEKLFVYNLNN